jgi:hypothetical protein
MSAEDMAAAWENLVKGIQAWIELRNTNTIEWSEPGGDGIHIFELEMLYYALKAGDDVCLVLESLGVEVSAFSDVGYDFADYTSWQFNQPKRVNMTQYRAYGEEINHTGGWWSMFLMGSLPGAAHLGSLIEDVPIAGSENWKYYHADDDTLYVGTNVKFNAYDEWESDLTPNPGRRYYVIRDFLCRDLVGVLGIAAVMWLISKILGSTNATNITATVFKVKSNIEFSSSLNEVQDYLETLKDAGDERALKLDEILSRIGLRLRL